MNERQLRMTSLFEGWCTEGEVYRHRLHSTFLSKSYFSQKKKKERKEKNLSSNEFDFSFCFYDNIIVIKQTFATNKKIYINTREEYDKNEFPLDED